MWALPWGRVEHDGRVLGRVLQVSCWLGHMSWLEIFEHRSFATAANKSRLVMNTVWSNMECFSVPCSQKRACGTPLAPCKGVQKLKEEVGCSIAKVLCGQTGKLSRPRIASSE